MGLGVQLAEGGGDKMTYHRIEWAQSPVPAKPNILYSRGSFDDIVCWTVYYRALTALTD